MKPVKPIKKKYLLEGKNQKIARQMLKDVTTILEKHNISYWLDFGTLLGIVRENRILPWDSDIDISIFAKDREIVHKKVMPEIKKLNYRIYSRYHATEDEVFRKGDFRSFKVRNYKWFFFKGYVKLDIFVMYEKNGFLYWKEFGKRHKIPLSLLDEFDKIDFENKLYTKPKDHDKFLTYHYGDWKTPNKNYISEIDGIKTLDNGQ